MKNVHVILFNRELGSLALHLVECVVQSITRTFHVATHHFGSSEVVPQDRIRRVCLDRPLEGLIRLLIVLHFKVSVAESIDQVRRELVVALPENALLDHLGSLTEALSADQREAPVADQSGTALLGQRLITARSKFSSTLLVLLLQLLQSTFKEPLCLPAIGDAQVVQALLPHRSDNGRRICWPRCSTSTKHGVGHSISHCMVGDLRSCQSHATVRDRGDALLSRESRCLHHRENASDACKANHQHSRNKMRWPWSRWRI
mmetsp:Transcript_138466/g.442556  ORF Transcript_138466/g.442556 Transcript_138466/m.442556 type:complete len:260 (+) Transcript_138466:477-1256(+)